MIVPLVWFLALVGGSAFLAAFEAAFLSHTTPLEGWLTGDTGGWGSRALQQLSQRHDRTTAALMVGRVLTAGPAIVIGAGAVPVATGTPAFVLAIVFILLIVLVAGEMLPRALGRARADTLTSRAAPLILGLTRVLFPMLLPLEALTRMASRIPATSAGAHDRADGSRDARAAATHEDPAAEHRRRITERTFRLDDTRAWNVMTPRVDMFAWPASLTLSEIAVDLRTVRYSRVPVYGTRIDNVVGVLYTRDAYQALVGGQRDVTLGELAREPYFVPGSIPLTQLLENFQARRIHMGIVIDEYGGTDGLVTLEDILEELVGEIFDETDDEHPAIIRVSRTEILVEGNADLREINHFFNTSFPQLEHRSLNGYLLDSFGYVPRVEEEIEREGVRIRIVVATDQQVVRARLSRPHIAADGPRSPGG